MTMRDHSARKHAHRCRYADTVAIDPIDGYHPPMRTLTPLILAALLVACGGGNGASGTTTPTPSGVGDASLARGVERMQSGQCDAALREDFLPMIAQGEREANGRAIRSTRTPGPAGDLQALLGADPEQASVAVGSDYPDMIYFAAYCAVELGDLALAEQLLGRALQIIPDDPAYLCELGHVAQAARAFDEALEIFERAERSAAELSARFAGLSEPVWIIGHDLPWWHRRALRGIGFSLIELGRLDEAEQIYRRVLAIDPGDEQAATELRVIDEMRVRSRSNTL